MNVLRGKYLPGGKLTIVLIAGILVVLIIPPPKKSAHRGKHPAAATPAHIITTGDGSGADAAGRATAGTSSASHEAVVAAAKRMREKQSWERMPWPGDPFWPSLPESRRVAGADAQELGALRLEGTLCGGVTPTAIIEGEVVSPGDMIHGARVEKVSPGEVALRRNGVTVKLSLPSASTADN